MIKTVIHKSNEPRFGEKSLLQMAGNTSFSDMVFEMFSGIAPSKQQSELFQFILVLSVDHGPDTPSAQKTIQFAKEMKNISESVGKGLEQINDMHGGAIEPAMDLFYQIKNTGKKISDIVGEFITQEKKIPGFGHRIYKVDPRAESILQLLNKSKTGNEYASIAREVEKNIFLQKSQQIPLNIDGAIAVVLCEWNWNPKIGKAVFITARTPGLCAHWLQTVIR